MTLFAPEHHAFRSRARSFVDSSLAPYASAWESAQSFPKSVFADLAQAGLLGQSYDPAYGGGGRDFAYDIVLAEELPRCRMLGLSLSVLAHTNIAPPLLARLGTDAQKREFLAPALQGTRIAGFASTEPSGGSDPVRAVQTTAVDDGDFWVVSGEKKYITNAPIADFLVLVARTRPEPSIHSLTLLLLPTDTPGLTFHELPPKLGMHSSPTGWFTLDRCRIPKSYTLGKPNLGYHYFLRNILEERLVGGAAALAAADLALHDTIAYLRQRHAYGQPLAKMQSVRHRIADLAAAIEMGRRFVHSVAANYRDGHVEAKEICMIKFHVFESVQRVAQECLQLHGASGFFEDNWIARMYRDVRVFSVGGGASELMRDLVAAYLRL